MVASQGVKHIYKQRWNMIELHKMEAFISCNKMKDLLITFTGINIMYQNK